MLFKVFRPLCWTRHSRRRCRFTKIFDLARRGYQAAPDETARAHSHAIAGPWRCCPTRARYLERSSSLNFISGVLLSPFSHAFEFHIVVCGDTRDCNNQARYVDGRQLISEYHGGGCDCKHLLEDAADAQRHDACSLQKGEFRRRH